MIAPVLRGTAIGSALGILPGSGSILGSLAAYSMLLARGNPWVFVQRPISATLLALAVLAMCSVLVTAFSKTRAEAFVEGSG